MNLNNMKLLTMLSRKL